MLIQAFIPPRWPRLRAATRRHGLLLAAACCLMPPAVLAEATARDWDIVATMPPGVEAGMQLVLVPESRRRDRRYFRDVGEIICGKAGRCAVIFWTDRKLMPAPDGEYMSLESLRGIVAQYTVIPGTPAPLLQLPCSFYKNPQLGRVMNCLAFADPVK